jgi:hypothetical protein
MKQSQYVCRVVQPSDQCSPVISAASTSDQAFKVHKLLSLYRLLPFQVTLREGIDCRAGGVQGRCAGPVKWELCELGLYGVKKEAVHIT